MAISVFARRFWAISDDTSFSITCLHANAVKYCAISCEGGRHFDEWLDATIGSIVMSLLAGCVTSTTVRERNVKKGAWLVAGSL